MSESKLQKAVAKLLDASGLLWCHVPNGGQRSIATASRLKAEGVKRGVPDILIFEPHHKRSKLIGWVHYVGLAIELKDGKKGVVSADQKRWMERLSECGWRAEVCRSGDEVIALLSECYPEKFSA
jgi:hypothetical protein